MADDTYAPALNVLHPFRSYRTTLQSRGALEALLASKVKELEDEKAEFTRCVLEGNEENYHYQWMDDRIKAIGKTIASIKQCMEFRDRDCYYQHNMTTEAWDEIRKYG